MYNSIQRSWISLSIADVYSLYRDFLRLRSSSDSIQRSGNHVSIIKKPSQYSNHKQMRLLAINSEEHREHLSKITGQEKQLLSNEHIHSRRLPRRSMNFRNSPPAQKTPEMILEFFLFSSPISGEYIFDHSIFSTIEPDNCIIIGDQ